MSPTEALNLLVINSRDITAHFTSNHLLLRSWYQDNFSICYVQLQALSLLSILRLRAWSCTNLKITCKDNRFECFWITKNCYDFILFLECIHWIRIFLNLFNVNFPWNLYTIFRMLIYYHYCFTFKYSWSPLERKCLQYKFQIMKEKAEQKNNYQKYLT